MDALTDIVQLLRPQTVLLGGMAAWGDWGVRVPEQPGPTFYIVTEGGCWFQPMDEDPIELCEGDYVLSSRSVADAFLNRPGMHSIVSDAAFKSSHMVDGEVRLGGPADGPGTRIIGGTIMCDAANADLLAGLLPRFVHVRASAEAGSRLRKLVSFIREEADEARPGRDAIVSRLIEVMLIETLRGEAEAHLPQIGVLGALAHPQLARALAYIHGDVSRDWTVAELARRAGMSRSVFARRFSETVGAAPVEYLLRWRMAIAKDALRHGHGRLDEIAAKVGYQSASAFSTAFRQRVGCPPSDYAAGRRGC